MPTRTEALRQAGAKEHTPHSARELLAGSLGADPYERIETLREAGERKARAAGVATQLHHERKIVLARIASEIASAHAKENLSEAKLDRLARADPRYQRHVEGMAAAVEEKEEAESSYWASRSEDSWDQVAVSLLQSSMRLGEPGP